MGLGKCGGLAPLLSEVGKGPDAQATLKGVEP
jgi:hypothetical protein